MRPSGVDHDDHHHLAYLILGGIFVLVCITIVVAVGSLGAGGDSSSAAQRARAAQLSKLPVYWTVRRGDTYERISAKTGLTISELETFNPYVDPSAIVPGQRLKLRAKVPKPKPKPLGPRLYRLKAGDSYGSIAARFHKDIDRLQELNPKLKAKALQPGDRVRLR